MRNPFDEKKLEDFTIEDCETYLSDFAFCEHDLEVRQRLQELKREEKAKRNSSVSPPAVPKNKTTVNNAPTKTNAISSNQNHQQKQTTTAAQTTQPAKNNESPEKKTTSYSHDSLYNNDGCWLDKLEDGCMYVGAIFISISTILGWIKGCG